jgi:hypothetical protein
MNPNTASNIQIRQTRAFDGANHSQHMAEEIISLARKLDECNARMGHSSVYTLQMGVQLLTKGKVRLQYRASEERLQLVKQSTKLARSEAIALVEKYLALKSPTTAAAANMDAPTQAIIIEPNTAEVCQKA